MVNCLVDFFFLSDSSYFSTTGSRFFVARYRVFYLFTTTDCVAGFMMLVAGVSV